MRGSSWIHLLQDIDNWWNPAMDLPDPQQYQLGLSTSEQCFSLNPRSQFPFRYVASTLVSSGSGTEPADEEVLSPRRLCGLSRGRFPTVPPSHELQNQLRGRRIDLSTVRLSTSFVAETTKSGIVNQTGRNRMSSDRLLSTRR